MNFYPHQFSGSSFVCLFFLAFECMRVSQHLNFRSQNRASLWLTKKSSKLNGFSYWIYMKLKYVDFPSYMIFRANRSCPGFPRPPIIIIKCMFSDLWDLLAVPESMSSQHTTCFLSVMSDEPSTCWAISLSSSSWISLGIAPPTDRPFFCRDIFTLQWFGISTQRTRSDSGMSSQPSASHDLSHFQTAWPPIFLNFCPHSASMFLFKMILAFCLLAKIVSFSSSDAPRGILSHRSWRACVFSAFNFL